MRELLVNIHVKNQYRTYRQAVIAISVFQVKSVTWNSRGRSQAFFLNEENPVSFTCVTVAIFNAHSRKASPVESTVKTVRSQRIVIQLESEK